MSASDTKGRIASSTRRERASEDEAGAARPGPEGAGKLAPGAVLEVSEGGDSSKIGMLVDNRYRIERLVGRGGMGSVYKAEHVAIRRTVAIKLLHPTLASIPEVSKRFEREAYAIGRIEHPNCVNVSDFGTLDDGSLYLVMEYLQGRSLGDLLADEKQLAPARAMHILRHVLRGLGHAHKAGIIHRDVKPENVILIEHDGDPDFAKILDFGIAKLIGEAEAEASSSGELKLTQAGVAFGTPIYMSPEQAVGNPVDARADLYAASVMAYEMIAGKPPFYSDDKLEVLSMHTTREVPLLWHFAGVQVPQPLEEILRRGMSKQPRERYQSALEYVRAIDEALFHLAAQGLITAPPPRPPTASDLHPFGVATGSSPTLTPPRSTSPFASPPMTAPVTRLESSPYASPPATGASPMLHAPMGPPTMPPGGADSGYLPTVPPPHPTTTTTTIPPETLRRLKRGAAYVGGGLVALFAVVLIATAGDSPPPMPADEAALAAGDDAGLAEEPAPVPEEPPSLAARANELLTARGDPQAAIELLEDHADEVGDDPEAMVQLGHAYAALRKDAEALRAYQAALALEAFGTLDDDPQLRANLSVMLDDRVSNVSLSAAELLIDTFDDDKGREALIKMAASGTMKSRRKAIELAERLGLAEEIDRVESYRLDLIQGDSCKIRREAVAKLRALGDPRAIPHLEKQRWRSGRGKWRKRNINACLHTAANEAIKYLKSLEETAPPDAGPARAKGDGA